MPRDDLPEKKEEESKVYVRHIVVSEREMLQVISDKLDLLLNALLPEEKKNLNTGTEKKQ